MGMRSGGRLRGGPISKAAAARRGGGGGAPGDGPGWAKEESPLSKGALGVRTAGPFFLGGGGEGKEGWRRFPRAT